MNQLIAPLKIAAFLALTALLSACASNRADDSNVVAGLQRLETRVRSIELGQESVPLSAAEADPGTGEFTIRDCMALKATLDFGKTLSAEELDDSVVYAKSADGASIRWILSRALVDRGRLDAAAAILVLDVTERPEQASHRFWNWWQFGFRKRPDYTKLSMSMTDALLLQFDTGSKESKLAVARIFGKGEPEAALGLAAFKQAIGDAGRS